MGRDGRLPPLGRKGALTYHGGMKSNQILGNWFTDVKKIRPSSFDQFDLSNRKRVSFSNFNILALANEIRIFLQLVEHSLL